MDVFCSSFPSSLPVFFFGASLHAERSLLCRPIRSGGCNAETKDIKPGLEETCKRFVFCFVFPSLMQQEEIELDTQLI